MRRARSHSFRAPAFTLIELILVLCILAVVAAIAVPTLRGFATGRRTNDAARQILAMMEFARTKAITDGTPCRFNADAASGQYWLDYEDHGAAADLAGEWAARFSLPEGVTMNIDAGWEDGVQRVHFQGTGRTDPATIRLTDAQGDAIEIRCASPTERFSISK